ncbi:MAG: DUF2760 domain-containing protein [Verrucomicrobia bacterium]|nr:DUF2760 domain-containing protein [Verrucomicrobiota bacterium]
MVRRELDSQPVVVDACRVKFLPLILAFVAAILLGLLWVPALAPQKEVLTLAATAAVVALIGALLASGKKEESQRPSSAVSPVPVVAPAATSSQGHADGAEAIGLLSALQENGRLVDFLMDDITAYADAQVGAAARIVHHGCRAVLDQHFAITPVCESAEGATISVPVSFRGDEYRLSGRLSGPAPFTGAVVHRGWKASKVKLPRTVVPAGQLPNIAPAEVEVRS